MSREIMSQTLSRKAVVRFTGTLEDVDDAITKEAIKIAESSGQIVNIVTSRDGDDIVAEFKRRQPTFSMPEGSSMDEEKTARIAYEAGIDADAELDRAAIAARLVSKGGAEVANDRSDLRRKLIK